MIFRFSTANYYCYRFLLIIISVVEVVVSVLFGCVERFASSAPVAVADIDSDVLRGLITFDAFPPSGAHGACEYNHIHLEDP